MASVLDVEFQPSRSGPLRFSIVKPAKHWLKRSRKLGASFRKSLDRLRKRGRAAANQVGEPIALWRQRRSSERSLQHDIRRIRSAARNGAAMRVPDFLIIGAPKSGTSWLRSVLCSHHGVIMVKEEVEFFSGHIDNRLDWYIDHFREDSPHLDQVNRSYRDPYADCLIGEKSASYCVMSARRIRLLKSLATDARFILMIRDPVRRHWAHASQFFVKRYGEGSPNASNPPKDQLVRFFEATKHFGEYSAMLDRWSGIFGRERLLVLLQEDALKEPERALTQVLHHVGASLDFDKHRMRKLFGTKNRGPGRAMPPEIREFLEEMFAPEYERLGAKLGSRLASWNSAQRRGSKVT